ncbi:hypothetical protein [Luteimonas mephitis]
MGAIAFRAPVAPMGRSYSGAGLILTCGKPQKNPAEAGFFVVA